MLRPGGKILIHCCDVGCEKAQSTSAGNFFHAKTPSRKGKVNVIECLDQVEKF